MNSVIENIRQGVSYHVGGDFEHAIGAYQSALKLDNDNATAHNNLGFVFGQQGQWDYDVTTQDTNSFQHEVNSTIPAGQWNANLRRVIRHEIDQLSVISSSRGGSSYALWTDSSPENTNNDLPPLLIYTTEQRDFEQDSKEEETKVKRICN